MFLKCPGQSQKKIAAETLNCPSCGFGAEIFSDEVRINCPACAGILTRQAPPSCMLWCKAARQCIGTAAWEQRKGE